MTAQRHIRFIASHSSREIFCAEAVDSAVGSINNINKADFEEPKKVQRRNDQP